MLAKGHLPLRGRGAPLAVRSHAPVTPQPAPPAAEPTREATQPAHAQVPQADAAAPGHTSSLAPPDVRSATSASAATDTPAVDRAERVSGVGSQAPSRAAPVGGRKRKSLAAKVSAGEGKRRSIRR